MVAPAPSYRPAFLSPPALVQSRSVPFRSAPSHPALIHLLLFHGLRWIETKKKRVETTQQSKKSYTVLCSKCPPLLPRPLTYVTSVVSSPCRQTPVNEKKGQKRCQRKNITKTTINQILAFVIPNFGPAARNSDGGETTDNWQRETKRRGRKHEYLVELIFQFISCCCCCCCCCTVSSMS